jgi:hypothetical protein
MFQTREGLKTGTASNGELKRWIKNSVLSINGFKITDPDELIDYPIFRVTLFTKQKMVTLM